MQLMGTVLRQQQLLLPWPPFALRNSYQTATEPWALVHTQRGFPGRWLASTLIYRAVWLCGLGGVCLCEGVRACRALLLQASMQLKKGSRSRAP